MKTAYVIALWLLLVPSSVDIDALAEAKFSNVRFTTSEITLLRRIKAIEDGANVSSSMLKAVPFVQIFTSTSPQEIAVTISVNDWDLIGSALQSLGKIKACQVVKEIDLFVVDSVDSPTKYKNSAFFDALRRRYDQGC